VPGTRNYSAFVYIFTKHRIIGCFLNGPNGPFAVA
jgi:hypothetical protein